MTAVALAELDALPDLAQAINAQVSAAEGAAKSAMQAALAAGELLIRAKQMVPHGQWEPWLLAHCAVAPRTAQAYMRLHTRLPLLPDAEAQRVADLPLRQAIAAVATAPTAPAQEPRIKLPMDETIRLSECLHKNAGSIRTMARNLRRGADPERLKRLRERLVETIAAIDSMERPR